MLLFRNDGVYSERLALMGRILPPSTILWMFGYKLMRYDEPEWLALAMGDFGIDRCSSPLFV